MQLRTKTLAWTAAGIFTVGAVTGWSAPAPVSPGTAASHARSDGDAVAVPAVAPLSGPANGGAPNYRAIVAHNQAAVVSITTAGDLNVSASSPSEDGINPAMARTMEILQSLPSNRHDRGRCRCMPKAPDSSSVQTG